MAFQQSVLVANLSEWRLVSREGITIYEKSVRLESIARNENVFFKI